MLAPSGPNNEGFPSSAPANGPSIEKAFVGSSAIVDNNHVHANPYPNVAGPGQPKLCEAGNENYENGKAVDRQPAGRPASATNREFTSREAEPVRRKVPGRDAQGPRHLDGAEARRRSDEEGEEEMSRLRCWRRHDEIPVVELNRTSPVRFAIVFLVIVAIAVYFGFTKHIPFKHGFRLNAQFASAVNIKAQVAGAHRRRQRRQGHAHQARGLDGRS